MDKNLLKYLAIVKTVDTGSFTKAADSLNYAQSSISKMIADLEKEWGISLLQRNKKGVCLTGSKAVLSGSELFPAWRSTGCRMCLQGFRKIIRGLIMKCFWAIMRKWKNGSMKDV